MCSVDSLYKPSSALQRHSKSQSRECSEGSSVHVLPVGDTGAVCSSGQTSYILHKSCQICVCVFVLMEPTDTNRQTDVTVDCQRRRDGQCKKLTEEHKGLERHKDSGGGDGEDSTQPLCTLLSPAQLPAMRNSSTAALSRKMQSTVSGALLHHLCLCVCVSIGSNHFHQLSCRAVGNHC